MTYQVLQEVDDLGALDGSRIQSKVEAPPGDSGDGRQTLPVEVIAAPVSVLGATMCDTDSVARSVRFPSTNTMVRPSFRAFFNLRPALLLPLPDRLFISFQRTSRTGAGNSTPTAAISAKHGPDGMSHRRLPQSSGPLALRSTASYRTEPLRVLVSNLPPTRSSSDAVRRAQSRLASGAPLWRFRPPTATPTSIHRLSVHSHPTLLPPPPPTIALANSLPASIRRRSNASKSRRHSKWISHHRVVPTTITRLLIPLGCIHIIRSPQ